MPSNPPLNIEVAYAEPGKQSLLAFQVACGTTARQAVLQSALVTEFPHVDFAAAPIGIFGKKVKDSAPLREGDRVEVYRALLIDPKENRRRKAAAKQKKEAT
ncbi:MAG: RnfH family protein [Eikenella corrodens]|uniref:RnfH family protein n=1 Tax=Eikenella corrodens TaxID=539 RepID=UPI00290A3AD7|nr:RnfH family protein [Eikenella corrodens]MDU4300855.1 RnfH family protein [Eikenella corrodens]